MQTSPPPSQSPKLLLMGSFPPLPPMSLFLLMEMYLCQKTLHMSPAIYRNRNISSWKRHGSHINRLIEDGHTHPYPDRGEACKTISGGTSGRNTRVEKANHGRTRVKGISARIRTQKTLTPLSEKEQGFPVEAHRPSPRTRTARGANSSFGFAQPLARVPAVAGR